MVFQYYVKENEKIKSLFVSLLLTNLTLNPFTSSGTVFNCLKGNLKGGHSGRVVTLLPPTSKAGVRYPTRPQVGKLVVGRQFTVQNLDQLYVLVSSALPTTHRDMTCTVLKAT